MGLAAVWGRAVCPDAIVAGAHRLTALASLFGRCGFCVYDEADAPDGGPHIWFMRWDS